MTIDLDIEERRILQGVLESYLSDLRMEISHTDRLAFREMLKKRKKVLHKMLDVLRADLVEDGAKE
jgi:hypothetical protein